MEILKLLDSSTLINNYDIQDYKHWSDGFYYKLKVVFVDESVLFAREYFDTDERNYSFHWQNKQNIMIIRWDNAPHHHDISTFPHHKHSDNEISESNEISLEDAIEFIQKIIMERMK
ncbi:MAG: hypothetical protein HQK63_05040 [Desulfamplus sp.]|nr:hypothetical protein [Desulfamplus sp.]MBF0228944.1 hypothetical protein [Desulfamplus sp.]